MDTRVSRLSSMRPVGSSDSSETPVQISRKSKRLASAGKQEMLIEIDSLQEEVEVANARLRSATEEVNQLRKRVDEQEDGGGKLLRSPSSRFMTMSFGDLATEAEVRWSFFVGEKSRLQSEKGWRQALKDSKKMLEEQLSDAHAQTRARDMELTNMRTRCCDGANELEQEKKKVMELKVMVTDLQQTLASEHQLLAQANKKNSQLQEELSAMQYTKESNKMTFARGEKRLVTCDLASQLKFNYEDSEEDDEDDEEGDRQVRFQEEEDSLSPHHSVRSSIQLNEDHALQSVRSSIQQQQEEQPNASQTVRNSLLRASETARQELEAQVAELQRRLQHAEHQVPSTQLQEEPALKRRGGDEICEQCAVFRDELAKVSKAQDNAKLEARDVQRRFEASEHQRQELEVHVSEMHRRAQLAEKQFRAWQAPWWSRIACHCGQKRPNQADLQPKAIADTTAKQVAVVAEEEQLQLSRPPRAAVHMEPAKNLGASWLARPLG